MKSLLSLVDIAALSVDLEPSSINRRTLPGVICLGLSLNIEEMPSENIVLLASELRSFFASEIS